jgi:hypothetical protein
MFAEKVAIVAIASISTIEEISTIATFADENVMAGDFPTIELCNRNAVLQPEY